MMKKTLMLFFLLFPLGLIAQQRTFTISGYIYDSQSGETLIGAGILSKEDNSIGTVTNEFGYYSLTISSSVLKSLDFSCSYVGYSIEEFALSEPKDTVLNLFLTPSNEIKEAVVVAHKEAGIKSAYLGSIEVPLQHIKLTPMLLGENDILKSLQLLPGVQGGNEGFTGLYVRGGGPDENLIMLDGIPIYNVDHMLGLFSVFQAEAVKKVTLYKGSFPARYSGRVSSIVDVRTNDGNMKQFSGSVTLGIISNKLHLEGPIVKDKLSFSLSARGMMSAIYTPIILAISKADFRLNYYFYDINGKLTWRINDNDRLYLSSYIGADVLKFSTDDKNTQEVEITEGDNIHTQKRTKFGTSWGNRIVALRWNHIFNNQLFANTTLAYNHYIMGVNSAARDYKKQGTIETESVFDFTYNSGIRDFNAKIDFDYKPNGEHIIRFGGGYVFHIYTPEALSSLKIDQGAKEVQKDTSLNYRSDSSHYGHEMSLYAEDSFNIGERLTLNPGLHFAWFNTGGKNYFSLQPRVNAKLDFYDYSFKAGYSRMAQYIHLLSSSSFSLPMDLWVPITNKIRPVTSDQFSIGAYGHWIRGWEFSIETYLKLTNNILEYKDGISPVFGSTTNWEKNVNMGRGRSYGIEFMAEKTLGQFTGWASYTLSKSERIFEDGSINAGRWFPYKYDRRHNINLCGNYKISEKVDLNATWQFMSGGAMTIATGEGAIYGTDSIIVVDEVLDRNNYRLPPSHKLNVSVNLHHKCKRGESIWNFSIYNLYNNMNPNFVLADMHYDEDSQKDVLKLTKITILPIIPAVSFTRTF